MRRPVCEKVCWVDSPAFKNEAGSLLRAALSFLASLCWELPYNGGGEVEGGAYPIDDWIGRRCIDRGTSIIAYLILLGTKWERHLKGFGEGDTSPLSVVRGGAGFLECWTGPEEFWANPPPA